MSRMPQVRRNLRALLTDDVTARCSVEAEPEMLSFNSDLIDARRQSSDCQGPEMTFSAALSQQMAGLQGKQSHSFACWTL